MFNVIRIPTKFIKTIKRLSSDERLQIFDYLIQIGEGYIIDLPDSIVGDMVSLVYGEWMNMEAKNGNKPEKSSINHSSEGPGEVCPSDPDSRVEYSRVEENRVEYSRDIVSIETEKKEIQNIDEDSETTYQDSMSLLKRNGTKMDNGEQIECPDFTLNYPEEWFKFNSYWTEKDRKGRTRAELQKTFDIKRRFATWISKNNDTKIINPITRIGSL